jgi:hypothetical protein
VANLFPSITDKVNLTLGGRLEVREFNATGDDTDTINVPRTDSSSVLVDDQFYSRNSATIVTTGSIINTDGRIPQVVRVPQDDDSTDIEISSGTTQTDRNQKIAGERYTLVTFHSSATGRRINSDPNA